MRQSRVDRRRNFELLLPFCNNARFPDFPEKILHTFPVRCCSVLPIDGRGGKGCGGREHVSFPCCKSFPVYSVIRSDPGRHWRV